MTILKQITVPSALPSESSWDSKLLLAVILLLGVGILMVYSATSMLSAEMYGSKIAMVLRHVVAIVIGVASMVALSFVPIKLFRRFYVGLFCFGVFLLLLVLIPGVGSAAGGAQRWIVLGPLRMQPAELMKLIVIVATAGYIAVYERKMLGFKYGALMPFLITGGVGVLLLLQPDFGSTVVVLSIVFFQLLTSSRLMHLFLIGITGLCSLAALAVAAPYRMKRIQTFLDPFQDPSDGGYQLIQSLIAVGSGGIWGLGLGAGKQKLFYLPAAHNDFIFAVIAEELGLIGAIFVLLLFLFVLYRGLRIAHRLSTDAFACSLALGCTLLIVLPALLNIGVSIALLPTKGMVLPLVGYGGTSMVVNLAAVGILLGLSRRTPRST